MQKHLEISIKASYHTLNELTEQTKNIWLVCHGQGQLAEFFIKKFEILDSKTNYIIAPQGLSKYYLNGFTGRVGASWMTKEDREIEITNQQDLLKSLWQAEVGDLKDRQIIFFGFSQGAATISRLVAHSKLPFNKMILWAGSFAHDVNSEHFKHLSGKETLVYFTAEDDPFYQDGMVDKQKRLVEAATGLTPKVNFYEGGHKVVPELLPSILD